MLRAAEAGVNRWVSIASDVDDAERALELVRGRAGAWCTAGVHPHQAGSAASDAMSRVRSLATNNREVVAIGETGLDFYYDTAPRDVQRALFEQHLELAGELTLPVIVHAYGGKVTPGSVRSRCSPAPRRGHRAGR